MERDQEPCRRKSYSSISPCSNPNSTGWCTRRSSRSSTRCLTRRPTESANASCYERTGGRKAYRVDLKIPRLKGEVFRSQVIERYRRREESVEEALMEMYMAGVSTRRVDDISQLCLWSNKRVRRGLVTFCWTRR